MTLLGKRRLLQFWIKGHSVSDCCGGMPFKWDKEEEKFVLKTIKQHKVYLARILIAFLYWLFCLVQVYLVWELTSTVVALHSILFGTTYFLCLTCHYVNWTERNAVVELFNNLVLFEKDALGNSEDEEEKEDDPVLKKLDLVTICVMFMQTQTSITMPPLYQTGMATNPCYPVNLGYWLSERCSNDDLGVAHAVHWGFREVGVALLIQFVSYTNWMFVLTPYCYNIAYELVLHGHCFRSYIYQYGQ